MADKGNTPPGDSEPAKPPAVSDTNHESTDLTAKAPTLEVSGEAGRAHPTSRDENTGDVSENAVKRTPEKSNISVHDAPNPIEMDLAMLDAMEQERQRIASYGSVIPDGAEFDRVRRLFDEQERFMKEYHAYVARHSITGLTLDAHEHADLLARVAMPQTHAGGLDASDVFNVERIQTYGRASLLELDEEYRRTRNPVYAWEALAVAHRYLIDLPAWVEEYLAEAGDRILAIRDEIKADEDKVKIDEPVGKVSKDHKSAGKDVRTAGEAERVGKALGFGASGPGQTGWFKSASLLERGRYIYFYVCCELKKGTKLYLAYEEVARMFDVSTTTVVNAYQRIKALIAKSAD